MTLEVVPKEIEVMVEEERPGLSTSIREKRLSRSISPRRGMWKREASNSRSSHSRRKWNEKAGR